MYKTNELLFFAGHKWRSHRKLIAPTFHLNVLKSFIELFNDNSRHVCKKMRDLNGKTFDCHDYMVCKIFAVSQILPNAFLKLKE